MRSQIETVAGIVWRYQCDVPECQEKLDIAMGSQEYSGALCTPEAWGRIDLQLPTVKNERGQTPAPVARGAILCGEHWKGVRALLVTLMGEELTRAMLREG
jgi:hypothetical protein